MSLLSACGGSPKSVVTEQPTNNLPAWVLNPVVEDGIAAADC